MVRAHHSTHFGIDDGTVSVKRHEPEDFIVRSSRLQDLDAVLHTAVHGATLSFVWHPCRRTTLAASGSFHFRVLLGMSRVPLHAWSLAMAQSKLGTACAHLELAPIEASPQVDDREFFVATWCLDPRFIPEEKTIFVPEPNVRVPGNALFLDADEIVLNKLPGLRYLVQIRVVEYQDWSTPPPLSLDDGREFRRDDDSGSGDSNYNRRHPGLDDRGGRPRGPGFRSYRLAGNDDAAPSLGGRREPTFPPHRPVTVGAFACPLDG
jgi:hypothetical protein